MQNLTVNSDYAELYDFKNTDIKNIEINGDCCVYKSALYNCTNLESITFNGNAEVMPYALRNCKNLKEITINQNADLASSALYGCDSLENIIVNTDTASITGNALDELPNLFYINSEPAFDSSTGDFRPEIKDFVFNNFNGADDVGFINQYVLAQVQKAVDENITDDMTDMQKVKVLHDWVCSHTKYDYGVFNAPKNHNDASIFLNDSTVCEGYARACNLLCNAAGIESYYVHSSDHAWNVVKLGGHYFHVDSTWDDGDNISHDWFLKSDSELKEAGGSHAAWSLIKPSSLHSFQGSTLPECEYSMGDMNTDGSIGVSDLVLMNQYLLGMKELNQDDYILSDLNFDGVTDSFDMVKMRQAIINK